MSEAYPEAAALLQAAGWKPHDGWNVYTRDTLVMGFQPDGQAFHVKNWAAIQEGHPQWTADTPDTAEEAAAWLVERFKPNPLTTEATLDPVALQREEVENPGDESDSETGEVSQAVQGDEEPVVEHDVSGVELGTADELDARSYGDEPGEYTDADFTEGEDLGSELLDAHDTILEGGDPWSTPELPAPEPIDFAPDEIEPEPENDQARFYGLDDLDRVKRLRIGDVAAEAAVRIAAIEAEVNEREGEYAIVQGFVVTNLDKHTGAFTLQDEASITTARRFYELDSARSRISVVDQRRREATAWLLHEDRTREDVVDFSVPAAFA